MEESDGSIPSRPTINILMNIDLSIPGWTLEYDLRCLAWLANSVPANGHIVEIGSFCGRSTYTLLNNRQNGCVVTAIDNFVALDWLFSKSFDEWPTNILGDVDKLKSLPITKNNHTWYRPFNYFIGEQTDFTLLFTESQRFDKLNANFAFIDGDHINDFPLDDMRRFLHNPECLIAVDDWDAVNLPDVDRCINIAKFESERAVYVAPKGRIAYLLPLSGPMLIPFLKFIELSNQTTQFINTYKVL